MPDLATALARAARRLLRAPTYTLTVAASLALGIGVVTAAFALVDAVLLRPLPYPDARRLVAVRHAAAVELPERGVSPGIFLHYRDHNRVFTGIGVYVESVLPLTEPGAPEQVRVARVSPEVLPLVGAVPAVGRLPTGADAEPGAPPRLFVSDELWARRFGRDPGVVGRTVEVGRRRYEVAGVMAPGFHFPHPETHVWITWPQKARGAAVAALYQSAVARLRPGLTPRDAQADLQRLVGTLPEAYGDVTAGELRRSGLRAEVVPFADTVVGDVRPALWLLLGTAAALLLITWANAVNLTLVRAEAQRRDVAVERALGAAPAHLAARFFGESALVAAAGGAAGLLLAREAVAARFGFDAAGGLPRLDELTLSPAAAALGVALTAATALLLGGAATARAGRGGAAGALAAGNGRMTGGRRERGGRAVLVAGQVALALTLLVCAALMARSFWRLSRAELGFRAEGASAFHVPLPPSAYGDYHAMARLHAGILDGVRAIPGVEAAEAASVSAFPMTPAASDWNERVAAAELPPRGAAWPSAQLAFATPGYFRAMGIPLVRGRAFRSGEDMASGGPSVVLSASLARALFGGADPVGRRVRWADLQGYPDYTVVGVAGDVPGESLREGPTRVVYFANVFPPAADSVTGPLLDYVPDEEVYVVRSSLAPAALAAAVERVVRGADPKLVVEEAGTLEELVAADRARARLTLLLLLVGAGTALFLGVVGIYGILAYAVRQRTPELGVRLALGATPAGVAAMVVREGARLALAGTAVGVAASLALTRFLRGLLYQVSPGDPLAFAATAALLLAVALAASYLPARRAGRIDPVRALRGE